MYKSVFKNAAYIFFIKLFPAFAGVVVLILYSRNLSQEDYGNYQDFWVKLLLFGTLAYVGLPVTIITYSADVIKGFIKKITAKHFLLYALWSQLCAAFFYYFLQKIEIAPLLLVALLMLYVIHSVQEAMLMASKKMNGLLAVNFFYSIYFLFIHYYFLNHYSLEHLLLWLMFGMLVRAVILFILNFIVYKKIKSAPVLEERLSKAKKLWLHLGFYDLIQTLFRHIDKFIIASFLPASLFAVYFNGSQSAEVPLLPYLLGAVASSVLIQLSDKQNDASQSYKLLRDTGKLLSSIVFPLFFFLFFFAEEIFFVVFTEKYLGSVPVFMMAILVLPLRSYNYTVMLQHLHQGAVINKGAVLDLLLALLLLYPFYLLFGLPGVALSFVISTYMQVGYYLWHTAKLLGVSVLQLLPFKNWMMKLLLFGALFSTLHWGVSNILSKQMMLVTATVILIVTCVLSLRMELIRLRRE